MFNTEIIHFLQAADHPLIYWFMTFISALGSTPLILTIVFGITFGVDFRKGLVLVNIVAWTAMITSVFKQQIDFPRPPDVDITIRSTYEPTGENLSSIQPKNFFENFSPALLKKTQNDDWKRFGFPSGHASIQIALWMTLFFLFRKKWIGWLGFMVVFLTLISRLYLGHHFLADVLGGLILGGVISGLLILLVKKTEYLYKQTHHFKSLSILWLPIIAIPFVQFVPLWILGSMIGLNLASILIILQRNFPVFHILIWKRVLAAFISLSLVLIASYTIRYFSLSNSELIDLLIIILINFVLIRGSIFISNRLNLIRFRY